MTEPTPEKDGVSNCEVLNPASPSSCLICVYGFYPLGEACLSVSELCDGHDVSNGNCFACKYALTLTSGKCIDTNCLTFQNNRCQKCQPDFTINAQGICQYSDLNCLTSDTKRCIECALNYFIDIQGKCNPLPEGCKFANVVNG